MKPELRTQFERVISQARASIGQEDWDAAWRALERAHILSQPFAWPHAQVHWKMLGLGLRQRDRREVKGQVLRLALAIPGSLTGKAPRGNTGRSSVGIFTQMALPEDLEQMLD